MDLEHSGNIVDCESFGNRLRIFYIHIENFPEKPGNHGNLHLNPIGRVPITFRNCMQTLVKRKIYKRVTFMPKFFKGYCLSFLFRYWYWDSNLLFFRLRKRSEKKEMPAAQQSSMFMDSEQSPPPPSVNVNQANLCEQHEANRFI